MVHSVTSRGGTQQTQATLGPVVVAQVKVNEIPTEALIDTGSPMTIISLEFLMEVLEKERDQYGSIAEWEAESKKRFSPPTVALKNYGGHWTSWPKSTSLFRKVDARWTPPF